MKWIVVGNICCNFLNITHTKHETNERNSKSDHIGNYFNL